MSAIDERIARALYESTGLQCHEVLAPGVSLDSLLQLLRELLEFFPEHAHVAGELAEDWAGRTSDPDRIPHAWLLRLQEETVGFVVFHTNLRRGILLQHFVGMRPAVRASLPTRWIFSLADALRDTGVADCAAHGATLLAAIGENAPEHRRAWERFGYVTLDVEYLEPHFGRHWREHGDPRYFSMVPQMRLTEPGRSLPLSEVAQAALCAFLLDHYQLPDTDECVVRTLSLACAL